MWLDFSALGMSKEELSKFMQEKAKIALDDGYWFGQTGEGFEMNEYSLSKIYGRRGNEKNRESYKRVEK